MNERSRLRGVMIASTVGMLFFSQILVPAARAEGAGEGRCYGVNACKAKGDCGGKGHGCAGENSCKAKGYLKIDKDTCLKINGGRLTEKPAAKKH